MPRYAVLDTEGTGLFKWDLPADHHNQPYLASLSIVYVDENGKVERTYSAFVKPDGWTMTPGATEVNGLTDEFLAANGIAVKEILEEYTGAVLAGYIVTAFNSQHDCKQLRSALRRAGMDDLFDRTPNICLMRANTNICKILKANPRTDDDYKFPKLSEAAAHYGIPYEAGHTATGDAMTAFRIFEIMRANGTLPEPAIYQAKGGKSKEAYDARHSVSPKPKTVRSAKARPISADDEIPE